MNKLTTLFGKQVPNDDVWKERGRILQGLFSMEEEWAEAAEDLKHVEEVNLELLFQDVRNIVIPAVP